MRDIDYLEEEVLKIQVESAQQKLLLSKYEVDTAQCLSQVCIHVERIIGVVRQKYSLLESTLPIRMVMCNKGNKLQLLVLYVCDSVIPTE